MDAQNPTSHKNGLWGVLSLLGLLLSLFVLVLIAERGYQFFRTVDDSKPNNTFSVSAEGKVKAVPDTAIVSLGVIAQGKDAKEVQAQATQKINQITEYAKSLKIDKEDITTSQSSINPRYDWQSGQSKIIGYESNQTVTIKIRGVDKSSEAVGTLMGGAVDKGANSVYGSQFTIDDPDALKQEARKLAIVKAKKKAKELADEAGIKLGKVVSINESGSGIYPPIMYDRGMAEGFGGSADAKAVMSSPNIEVGSQEVTQSVTLIFEVK